MMRMWGIFHVSVCDLEGRRHSGPVILQKIPFFLCFVWLNSGKMDVIMHPLAVESENMCKCYVRVSY